MVLTKERERFQMSSFFEISNHFKSRLELKR